MKKNIFISFVLLIAMVPIRGFLPPKDSAIAKQRAEVEQMAKQDEASRKRGAAEAEQLAKAAAAAAAAKQKAAEALIAKQAEEYRLKGEAAKRKQEEDNKRRMEHNKAVREDIQKRKKEAEEAKNKHKVATAQEDANRKQTEEQLKKEAAQGADNKNKVLAVLHLDNAQIDEINAEIGKLQHDLTTQKLNNEVSALELESKNAEIKYLNETIALAKSDLEQTTTVWRNYKNLLLDKIDELSKEFEDLEQRFKILKEGTSTTRANEELRHRLAEADLATQEIKRSSDQALTEMRTRVQNAEGTADARFDARLKDEVAKMKAEAKNEIENYRQALRIIGSSKTESAERTAKIRDLDDKMTAFLKN